MSIRLICPRCQRHLSVAARKAGSYGQCPQCHARLWIPAGDAEDSDVERVDVRIVPPNLRVLDGRAAVRRAEELELY